MIAHVARMGEDRGRVVLQLGSAHPSTVALEAAVRVARAFQSEIESVFVEDAQLFDCAAYGFVREVSLTGRQRRVMSTAGMTQDLRLAARAARRQLEVLARRAEVPPGAATRRWTTCCVSIRRCWRIGCARRGGRRG